MDSTDGLDALLLETVQANNFELAFELIESSPVPSNQKARRPWLHSSTFCL